MKVINARNVNDALHKGICELIEHGDKQNSRNGLTLELPEPVATVYERPWEKVLLSQVRDANPFFHLMEAMWILAGRKDVKFLTEFNKRMADYSDDGDVFNAPYGHRLRHHFGKEQDVRYTDQITKVIHELRADSDSRQAVMQIWDVNDLGKKTKDKACNMSVVFRIRKGALDMTVYNRSNDALWGKYGANAVQFAVLQEYVAACLDLPVGTYTQVTNVMHVYLNGAAGKLWSKLKHEYVVESYNPSYEKGLVLLKNSDIAKFNYDLANFFAMYDQYGVDELAEIRFWQSDYFNKLVMPMLCLHRIYKNHGSKMALKYVDSVKSGDWQQAAKIWLENREA